MHVEAPMISKSCTFTSKPPQLFSSSNTVTGAPSSKGYSSQETGTDAPVEGGWRFAAATTVQKFYRRHRARRTLADFKVRAKEEYWRQAIEFARLHRSTISFFCSSRPENAASKWKRTSWHASKVGKGLSKEERAQILAFQYWIEAIDPRHRYGHYLRMYYEEWSKSGADQPFFYWLDVGDGKGVDLKECPRSKLRQLCIKYLGPLEREAYEYIVREGKVVHRRSEKFLHTNEGLMNDAKWIFVMSTSKELYVGQKKKGKFHHSSFLAGGATLAAGRIDADHGKLKSISPHSGHYRPTYDNFTIFLSFLKENGFNLDDVEVQEPEAEPDQSTFIGVPIILNNTKKY
ncbi:IQ domain-containing protein IQM3-like [Diospyros lotus]|uniref:IQ domain-containing protein IQM3-like n=1 Tax=Diospyros lotus TaxID=55363 RepID=UPI002258BFD6|nr:IQ domain-containing protein IQM3-like [Diospyros lotus]